MPIFIKIRASQVTSGPHFGDPLMNPLTIRAYNHIAGFGDSRPDVDEYADIKEIVGEENEALIDDIIRLVVSDNFFS